LTKQVVHSFGVAIGLEELYPNDTLTALASSSAADVGQRWDLLHSIGDRLCETDPDSPTSHCERSLGLLKLGRFDERVAEVDDALRLSGESGEGNGSPATATGLVGSEGVDRHFVASPPPPPASAIRPPTMATAHFR
jgi:hypothetical protein